MLKCKIVIDTCIFISASGGKKTENKIARDFLELLKSTNHIIIFEPSLIDEYIAHSNPYITSWLSYIVSKKRRYVIELNSIRYNAFRDAVDDCVLNQNINKKIKKDICLIEAAVLGDKIIFSYDDNMFAHLMNNVCCIKSLSNILWLNPKRINLTKNILKDCQNDYPDNRFQCNE